MSFQCAGVCKINNLNKESKSGVSVQEVYAAMRVKSHFDNAHCYELVITKSLAGFLIQSGADPPAAV